ncbi:phenazine biosynthesis FMN-dependent oxidase PhzG [Streptomyces sp. NPDC090499]|uniref:phenazine biosynthesis FMN-dependent oxidase PhzG n=1 Tax=Streptomyces sp. NPDC090499 TaxID=3365965 RepID=UPI0038233ADE
MAGSSKFETLTAGTHVPFPEYEEPPHEPIPLVRHWLTEAERLGVREPKALALATADLAGRASNRIVAITRITDEGIEFTSHTTSQKGREIAATGWASGVLYWRETGQQIVLSGPVTALPEDVCDALWAARPTPLHAMSTASEQSAQLDDVTTLRKRAEALESLGVPLRRPARFVGYLLSIAAVEFWSASPDRLHRRLRYDRSADGWRTSRLQP